MENHKVAIVGGGCFWCVEGVYRQLKGIIDVVPGYSGGYVENPEYRDVCSGITGHAEVVKVTYDPSLFTYQEILEVFFVSHDPTTLNRQGHDVGSQYRSIIIYQNEEEKRMAEEMIREFDAEKIYNDPIVTEVRVFETFYEAEKEHHDYYSQHSDQPYCQFVISPKIGKVRSKFAHKLK